MARRAPIDKRTLLAGNMLFLQLGGAELDRLVAYARVVRVGANQMIFHKGDPGTGMMAVLSGRVKISTMSVDGKEAVLNFIDQGEVFGEIALLDGKERTADATAMEDTELLVLDRRDFIPFLEAHPGFAVRLIELLCARLRKTSELVEDSFFLTLPARLGKRLLQLADSYGRKAEDGVRIELKLSQRELGSLIGLARENINRQLRAWQKEGLVDLTGGYITIKDEDALNAIAEDLD